MYVSRGGRRWPGASVSYDAYNETFVDDEGLEAWRRVEGDAPVLAPMITQVARRSLYQEGGFPDPPWTASSVIPLHAHRPRILPARTPPHPRPNTAVIAPVVRSPGCSPAVTPSKRDILPLLKQTCQVAHHDDWPVKNSPTIHLPTEMLCSLGFFLLASGIASTLLSFYILSVGGKRYFLNFGAVGGFTSLVLGVLSFRTNKWQWAPHRNYITGFVLVTVLSVIHSSCLGGIVYAIDINNSALLDTLGGAVSCLSILVMTGATLGLVTSGCCHRPPPDNRVAHSVNGFVV